MPARGVNIPSWRSWSGLVYYGETVGFVCAWIAGLAALLYLPASPETQQPSIDQVAAVER